ncbi:PstS family phosphate ABC transporter substrate-binding protein [Acaryochloris marina]|uniref:Phosphate-binding protein n=1 Tax=Acaryochloris marina (strain MBIC 11017) TaxID=329726 RepID=B0C7J4_ACAM1|nr:PstS family phosphate ABC transporter substrate-binding protein [Acaryochloris marina]ABW25254.1 phosphate ABC transporter, periplasmic phosphate-binding protein [Acaryochloris marina MBIC11017]BDM80215.1 protein sphX [Acaryochloris marina MBIC10699]
MQLNRSTLTGAVVSLAVAVSTTAFSATSADAQTKKIKIDGSSTVFPISEAVAEEFQKLTNNKVNVTVGVSGTGGGFKKFCAGETDISDASRPIKEKEQKLCEGVEYIEIPVAFDALTVVVNKGNPIKSMTVAELKKMWSENPEGSVTTWKEVNSSWPADKISFYAPGSDSGTFDYFNGTIAKKNHRKDITASEDDNILVQGVSREPNGIGYFGFAYYEQNKDRLNAVAIDNGNGPVLPSREAVENGTYTPLSRPIFIYVNKKAAKRPEVRQFVNYYLRKAAEFSAEVGYIPLPAPAYQQAAKNFREGKTGSFFAGRDTDGLKVSEVLKSK